VPAVRAGDGTGPQRGLAPNLGDIGRAAVAALYDELALEPKPGLVSFVDSGSHRDMDARTFWRSLFALRHVFPRFAVLGAAGADFAALQRAGILAEARMLAATGGVNTHRGAIFSLGLLCAAAGSLVARGEPLRPAALRETLRSCWGEALASRAADTAAGVRGAPDSHGARAVRAHGLRGAGAEAAAGFPVLFETTWPTLDVALRCGWPRRAARVQAFFATLAVLDDTNLAHRGGLAGLRDAQRAAADYLRGGGAASDDGFQRARALHRDFVARGASPGGSADLLAAACWLRRVV
jgi:triphosphoribosyl-dephospho-CoA synthase